jgi:hypothetical protein
MFIYRWKKHIHSTTKNRPLKAKNPGTCVLEFVVAPICQICAAFRRQNAWGSKTCHDFGMIYDVYIIYIWCIYDVYIMYILCIYYVYIILCTVSVLNDFHDSTWFNHLCISDTSDTSPLLPFGLFPMTSDVPQTFHGNPKPGSEAHAPLIFGIQNDSESLEGSRL